MTRIYVDFAISPKNCGLPKYYLHLSDEETWALENLTTDSKNDSQ